MHQPPGSPEGLTAGERVRHVANMVLKGAAVTCIGLVVIGWLKLIIMGSFVWEEPDQHEAATSARWRQPPPYAWLYRGSECRDGWDSPSIGRPGACSHHGGVVAVYSSAPGNLLRRRPLPTDHLEHARVLATALAGWGAPRRPTAKPDHRPSADQCRQEVALYRLPGAQA
jgi:hypothetical protein